MFISLIQFILLQTSNGGGPSGGGGGRPFSGGGLNKAAAASGGPAQPMATQHQTAPAAGYRTHQWGSVGAGHQHPAAPAPTYYRYAQAQHAQQPPTQQQITAQQQQQAQSPAQHQNSYTPSNPSNYTNSNSVSIFFLLSYWFRITYSIFIVDQI